MRSLCFVMLALLPLIASADYGRILYVTGKVTVERNGKLYRAVKSAKLVNGDKIQTGSSGRLHLRMADNTLISLKPNTDFVIESFRFAEARIAQPSGAAAAKSPADTSVFNLLKGGFRAITGLIGQRNNNAFSVSTPVATIGIRGTSFVADLSPGQDGGLPTAQAGGIQLADATAASGSRFDFPAGLLLAQNEGTPPGEPRLTVGVAEGRVILTNAAGSLILENGEFGEVQSQNFAPRRITRPLVDNELEERRLNRRRRAEQNATNNRNAANRVLPGQGDGPQPGGKDERRPDQQAEETVTRDSLFEGPRRDLAIVSGVTANGHFTQALVETTDTVQLGSNGELIGFIGGADREGAIRAAVFSLQGGVVSNQGFDPGNQLRWGRWSDGTMQLRFANGDEQSVPLSQAQLHFIASAIHDENIAVPVTGSRDFVLIGNTDPTNAAGQVGFLGDASLRVDFTNQLVDSSLVLSIDSQVWQASGTGDLGSGLNPATPDNVFAGFYDSVRVNGTLAGSGEFSGFLTERSEGAGLSYRLNNDSDIIHGTAAFAAGGSQ